MKKGLGMIAMAAALMADLNSPLDNNSKTSMNDIDFTPKQPPIPKGAKIYHFDEVGNCLYDVEHETAVFKCIAINEKSAIKKFSKWLSAQMKLGVV